MKVIGEEKLYWTSDMSVNAKENQISPVDTKFADAGADANIRERNKQRKMRDIVILWAFFREISFGGFKYLGNTSTSILRRVVWLFVVVSSLGGIIYMVNLNVQHLLARPTSSKVELVYTDKIKFPAITICNYNFVRGPIVQYYDPTAYEIVEAMYPSYFEEKRIPNFTGIDFAAIQFDMVDFVTFYGHQKETMIFRCTWKGIECTKENFTSVVTDFGICYTFNGAEKQEPLYSDSAGGRFGLSLLLNTEDYYYMNGPEESVGFKIFIADQSEIPQLQDFGFAISPGQETIVRLKTKQIQSLEAPYGSCGSKSLKYYNETDYTYSKCLLECQTDFVIDKCGCKGFYMPSTHNIRNCYPDEVYNCFYPELNDFAQLGTTSCACPISCNIIEYEPSLSYSVFPNSLVDDFLEENYKYSAKSNLAKVNIFFGEIRTELTSEQPAYESFNLFNDIGGSLGLLAGASVITVIEVVDFIAVHVINSIIRLL